MRAVIDTNCLLASIPPKNSHYWLYEAFRDEYFEWLISNEILTEYEEKLSMVAVSWWQAPAHPVPLL